MAEHRSFFWHGVLSLNDLGEHAIFNIKVRKASVGGPNLVALYTADLPPVPVRARDVVRIIFLLENNVGTATVRYKICASSFHGALLEKRLKGMGYVYVFDCL